MKHNIFKIALLTSALTILLSGGINIPSFVSKTPNPSEEFPIENEMFEENGIMPLSDEDDKKSCIVE